MGTRSRKAQERRDREALIVTTARSILHQKGYLGLNMDDIAERIEYSKGTIYQHFRSKEDLLVALVVQQLERRRQVLEAGSTFRGASRERMVALCEANRVFLEQNPDCRASMAAIRLHTILEKASGARRIVLAELETSAINAVLGLVHDALAHGDLEREGIGDPQDLAYGVWALAFGSTTPDAGGDGNALGIRDPMTAARRSLDHLLDGYRWKPLAADHDYAATRRRLREQLTGMD